MAVARPDGFNWGYDPWHYTVPEGSYATDPDGAGAHPSSSAQMVQGLLDRSACASSWTSSTTTPTPPARTTSPCSTASCPATTTA